MSPQTCGGESAAERKAGQGNRKHVSFSFKSMSAVEKLARELFSIGLAKRRDLEGYSDRLTWETSIAPSQPKRAAWFAIARHVLKHFTKRKATAKTKSVAGVRRKAVS